MINTGQAEFVDAEHTRVVQRKRLGWGWGALCTALAEASGVEVGADFDGVQLQLVLDVAAQHLAHFGADLLGRPAHERVLKRTRKKKTRKRQSAIREG